MSDKPTSPWDDQAASFNVLLADPPWSYRNVKTGGTMTSGAAAQYQTLTLDDLCSLPVSRVARADAVLFLWATVPLLLEAMTVLTAWGFEYKTTIVWDKAHEDMFGEVRESKLGMGMWFRGQIELLLLGVRGAVAPFRTAQRNVIRSAGRKHSAKPEEARRIIEAATASMPDRRLLELFARDRVDGWTSHGNALDGCDIREALARYVDAAHV
jgi:N6-adenosine-specific RNA methylase IME4